MNRLGRRRFLWVFAMLIVIIAIGGAGWLFLVLRMNEKQHDLGESGAGQLIVVRSADWNATTGTLNAYSMAGGWRHEFGPIAITLGRNGMAWGEGLHDAALMGEPRTREGAGKSPAWIFRLESLYGYGDLEARMPYLKVDENTFCVDDPASAHYNQIVRGDEVVKDWNSAETMRMTSDVYKYGIVVGYNTKPVKAGMGSCIFIHLGEPDGTTAGCTAMAEDDILKLISFLDKSRNPIIAQAPEEAYALLAKRYKLPE